MKKLEYFLNASPRARKLICKISSQNLKKRKDICVYHAIKGGDYPSRWIFQRYRKSLGAVVRYIGSGYSDMLILPHRGKQSSRPSLFELVSDSRYHLEILQSKTECFMHAPAVCCALTSNPAGKESRWLGISFVVDEWKITKHCVRDLFQLGSRP